MTTESSTKNIGRNCGASIGGPSTESDMNPTTTPMPMMSQLRIKGK